MTPRKTISLTRWNFVSKVMSLLFSTPCLSYSFFQETSVLISQVLSPPTVILEAKKIKFVTVSTFSPSICHEVMEPDAMILVFRMLSFEPPFSLSSFPFPGVGNGNPLQYSCLENSMDRGAWQATVHGVTKKVGHDLATKPPPPQKNDEQEKEIEQHREK